MPIADDAAAWIDRERAGCRFADERLGRRLRVGRSSATNAWILDNRHLALRYDRFGFIVQSLLQAACIFLAAGRVTREL